MTTEEHWSKEIFKTLGKDVENYLAYEDEPAWRFLKWLYDKGYEIRKKKI